MTAEDTERSGRGDLEQWRREQLDVEFPIRLGTELGRISRYLLLPPELRADIDDLIATALRGADGSREDRATIERIAWLMAFRRYSGQPPEQVSCEVRMPLPLTRKYLALVEAFEAISDFEALLPEGDRRA